MQLSERAEEAERRAPGAPADAVVWEEVEARTSEQTRLSASYLVFIVLAGLIACVGIFEDSPILIVGAMVVGPEFGPIAAFCVAVVERRPRLAGQGLLALVVGFPLAIGAVWLATLVFRMVGAAPDAFTREGNTIATSISEPNFFTFFVAFCAGMAGVLSLSTAKSGALIGVLISVTTIPAAADIGVATAYEDWASWRGSLEQLAINVTAILLAGTLTLFVQRLLYRSRRIEHLKSEPSASRATTRPRASSASAARPHR